MEPGYTVLISIGDQESDLAGGYAERTFKLPSPVYFLPLTDAPPRRAPGGLRKRPARR